MAELDEAALIAATEPLPDEPAPETEKPEPGADGDVESEETGEPGEESPDEKAEADEKPKAKRVRRTTETAVLRAEIEGLKQFIYSNFTSAQQPGDPPDPKDSSKYQLGDMDARYIADLAAHERRAESAQQAQQAKQAFLDAQTTRFQQEMEQKWIVQRGIGEKKYGAEKFARAMQEVDAVRPSQAVLDAIKLSDNGADVAMYLRAHPDEIVELSSMHPYHTNQEIARLSDRLAAAGPKRITNAPKPTSPVGGRESPSKRVEDMSLDEVRSKFKKKRA